MKKLALLFVALCTCTTSFAQKHEVKLDLLDALAFRTLDVSYEHMLNDEANLGLSLFINFEPEDSKVRYNENFQLTPYFRHFLKSANQFNFFGEVFGTLNSGKNNDKNYTDFGLGVGAGGKYISKNGYVFEFNAGVARNLFNADVAHKAVPRLGISVGKQF